MDKAVDQTCLLLCVKNESDNILDYLNLNSKEFKMFFMVDIDSTDNTVELVKKWCLDNDKQLKVHRSNKIISGNSCFKLAKKSFPNSKIKTIDW